MRSAVFLGALVLFVAGLVAAENKPNGEQPGLTLLSSADAHGELSLDRLRSCLHQLSHEWKQDEKALPKVVVFHVSKQAAQTAMVNKKVEVRRNRSAAQSDVFYEVWLVDAPTIADIVLAIDNVVEDYFQLKPTEDQRNEVMARAARLQNATLSVNEGK